MRYRRSPDSGDRETFAGAKLVLAAVDRPTTHDLAAIPPILRFIAIGWPSRMAYQSGNGTTR